MSRTAAVWLAARCLISAGAVAGCDDAGQPVETDPVPSGETHLTIRSDAIEFDTSELYVSAGQDFSIVYLNGGPLQHNVAIYWDDSARMPLFQGEVIETGQIVYEVSALPAGVYYFHCDVHPNMNGRLIAD